MLTTMENYLFRLQRRLRRWAADPILRTGAIAAAYGSGGFFLSAASLNQAPQPLAMGLICAVTGWRALVMALGAAAGYGCFWKEAGLPGMVWALGGSLLALLLGKGRAAQERQLLIPALASLLTALTGVAFLFFRGRGDFAGFCLGVVLAPVSAWFFRRAALRRDSVTEWICGGIGVLALAQVAPVPALSFGHVAAGIFTLWGSFPAAALAGLGLDLARITAIPMSVVVCCGWLARLLPFQHRWMRCFLPAASCLCVMALCGIWDPLPLPGLVLGGFLGYCLPPKVDPIHRRGETGIAQVRLELTAGVLSQLQQLLLETAEVPIDQAALLDQAVSRSCTDCPSRETCVELQNLCLSHLHDPSAFTCRRQERIRMELRFSRQQLHALRADKLRRQEYRSALIQQYQFLSSYLRLLSDQLPRRGEVLRSCYRLEVSARSKGKERANGDRCLAFPGDRCRYYVLLCDGMGTGLGAAQEGDCAGQLLKKMLSAGFPAEYALRTINSMLALRGQAGAVTLDLAEIRLDNGHVSLYKWGAAPSWLWGKNGAKKLGTAQPPPGISITDTREEVIRLSLHRGEMLILFSDGVAAGECLHRMDSGPVLPPGELAQWLLEKCAASGEDDATAAVLRIHRRQLST